ncbi:MAG TPA: MFS transporter, partial [Candidatus Binatia bacterium]|nr:MFS transporter [Candidatus Binatia bacterium]
LAALGVINFLFGFLYAALWRDPRSEVALRAEREAARAEAREPLNVWGLLPVSCATAIYLIGQMVLITYVPLYLKEVMQFSPYWASQALALTQAGAMVGRVGWGVASDRFFGGRRKIVLMIIGVISALSIGALGLIRAGSSYFALFLLLFVAGLCIVGYQGVSYALIGEIAGQARTGAGLGMMITINSAAATVGTPLFGHIVDRTGSYAVGWQVLAATICVGILGLAILLKEPKRGP